MNNIRRCCRTVRSSRPAGEDLVVYARSHLKGPGCRVTDRTGGANMIIRSVMPGNIRRSPPRTGDVEVGPGIVDNDDACPDDPSSTTAATATAAEIRCLAVVVANSSVETSSDILAAARRIVDVTIFPGICVEIIFRERRGHVRVADHSEVEPASGIQTFLRSSVLVVNHAVRTNPQTIGQFFTVC